MFQNADFGIELVIATIMIFVLMYAMQTLYDNLKYKQYNRIGFWSRVCIMVILTPPFAFSVIEFCQRIGFNI